jgi:hypothetical protein
VLDNLTGGAPLAAPGLLGLGDEPRAALILLRLAGGGAAINSQLTDYELAW